MKRILVLIAIIGSIFACNPLKQETVRDDINREVDFNFDWKFKLLTDTVKPNKIPCDDMNWRDIRLPHDWSVEHSFDSLLEGATGYLPGGVGVYQKHFKSHELENKNTYVLFDGVYNNATFWLNGKLLGENPYGYSPVYFDLTEGLNKDEADNILTVHVDHSRYVDSRWYTGSGIYRNVKLITIDKLHIPIWGTFITTPEVSKEFASINLKIKVENNRMSSEDFVLETKIVDSEGIVITKRSDDLSINASSSNEFSQNFSVTSPRLWHFNSPTMYKAISTVIVNGKKIDTYTTPFGIRSVEFKAGKGFFLNGENTLIKGVCLHHDGGLVGAAVPKGVWERRLKELKKAGVNGIRTSHNPYSQEFLDLCDEMGFLVQDEIFDELDYPKDKRQNYHDRHDDYISRGYTEHFQKWGKSDLTRTILRDRNHPSVIQWSIGNEIEWTYLHYRYVTGFWKDPNKPQKPGKFWSSAPMHTPDELKARYDLLKKGKYNLAETAKKVNNWVKELDSTRTTAANLVIPQVSHVSGYADAVDIAGYSYRNTVIDWAQKHFPKKQVTITECPGTWDDWKQVIENPGVYSIYMWTGIGYIGEKNQKWPNKSGYSDILDIAGFRVQGFNYFKSIWVDKPHVSIGTKPISESGFIIEGFSKQKLKNTKGYRWRDSNMHWNYQKGEDVLVEVCANYSIVELFLNGRSLGSKSMSECPDRIFRWPVSFEPGELKAVGRFNGESTVAVLETTAEPVGFILTADKNELQADAYDVSHLVVQLIDENGRGIKTENTKVTFEIEGDARLLGVDTGTDDNVQDFQSNSITTAKGRCLAIIQSTKNKGVIKVTAHAEGFESQTIEISVQ